MQGSNGHREGGDFSANTARLTASGAGDIVADSQKRRLNFLFAELIAIGFEQFAKLHQHARAAQHRRIAPGLKRRGRRVHRRIDIGGVTKRIVLVTLPVAGLVISLARWLDASQGLPLIHNGTDGNCCRSAGLFIFSTPSLSQKRLFYLPPGPPRTAVAPPCYSYSNGSAA